LSDQGWVVQSANVWKSPDGRVVMSETHAGNFIKDKDGNLRAIDVYVQSQDEWLSQIDPEDDPDALPVERLSDMIRAGEKFGFPESGEVESGTGDAPADLGARFEPDSTHANVLLYGDAANAPIEIGQEHRRTNSDIAAELQELAFRNGRIIDLTQELSEEDIMYLAQMMAEEAESALKGSGNARDWYTSSIEETTRLARLIWPEMAGGEGTPFKDSDEADFVFATAMAITSQNLRVNQNADYATQQMDAFIATGRFDEDLAAGYGDKAQAIQANFRLANSMLDRGGVQELMDIGNRDFTVKDLNQWLTDNKVMVWSEKKGKMVPAKVAGGVSDIVKGSEMFGPKIGGGFLQNLLGNLDPITIDLWMRRTWGRMTGNVTKGGPDAKQLGRLVHEINDRRKNDPNDGTPKPPALPAKLRRAKVSLNLNKDGTVNGNSPFRVSNKMVANWSGAEMLSWAKEANNVWQKYYRDSTAELNAVRNDAKKLAENELVNQEFERRHGDGSELSYRERQTAVREIKEDLDTEIKRATKAVHQKINKEQAVERARIKEQNGKLKPEWAKAALVVVGSYKPIDTPSPYDRRGIKSVVFEALKVLESKGIKMKTADLQATLWYPEKDLLQRLRGGKGVDENGDVTENGLNSSYDIEMKRIKAERENR